jgi:hypothetical protein
MTKIEQLEREVRALSARDLASFREWFAEFDGAAWDRQLTEDSDNGKLDRLADTALADGSSSTNSCSRMARVRSRRQV